MIYKDFQDLKLSALGFGTMRLPVLADGTIDQAEVDKMIDYAMANGVNYYDTAFFYHGGDSEKFACEALSRYPRESFCLATKLPGGHMKDNKATPEEIFNNPQNPRTKEFLAAFPAIMLTVYCAVRRLPFFTALFGLAGTIGMTSVCNTFMHIRTPLYLGFVRTGYSLLFGAILGCVMMIGFEILYRLAAMLLKKYKEAEEK